MPGKQTASKEGPGTRQGVYLKGVEEELAVHADLPPEPGERVRLADEHDVMHTKDQNQDQCGLGQLPGKEEQAFC